MNTVTDFPPIVDPVPTAVAEQDLATVALARFGEWRPQVAALVKKYASVALDLSTPKALEAGRKVLAEVRAPRFAAQNVSEASKSELAKVSKAIGAELKQIQDALKPTEDHIRAQIEAREEALEAEKEAARQAEANRVQKHRDGIERINAYVKQAQGLPSERISKGIAALQAMEFGESWEEFKEQAIAARDSTFVALQSLFATTKAREDGEIRLEMQRQEQARVAAEQRAEADRLAKAREELERQQREIIEAAERERVANYVQVEPLEPPPAVTITTSQPEAAPPAYMAVHEFVGSSGQIHGAKFGYEPGTDAQPEAAPPAKRVITIELDDTPPPEIPPPAPVPTLKLGTICDRLGFTITAVFISERLGIDHAATEKAAKLYHEKDFTRICERLVTRIREAQAGIY